MVTKRTTDLGLAIYRMGIEPENVEEYVGLHQGHNNFLWYIIEDTELQMQLGDIIRQKENKKFAVLDFYKLEHIIGKLKRMCIERKVEIKIEKENSYEKSMD